MSAPDLRAAATARSQHAEQCEQTAALLSARASNLDGLLDEVVALHTPSTWDSPTATIKREALLRRRNDLDSARADLHSVARDLYRKADEDRSVAASFRRQADQAEATARQAQMNHAAEMASHYSGTPNHPT